MFDELCILLKMPALAAKVYATSLKTFYNKTCQLDCSREAIWVQVIDDLNAFKSIHSYEASFTLCSHIFFTSNVPDLFYQVFCSYCFPINKIRSESGSSSMRSARSLIYRYLNTSAQLPVIKCLFFPFSFFLCDVLFPSVVYTMLSMGFIMSIQVAAILKVSVEVF